MPDQLDAYLARFQNVTEDRPLLMSEVGLDVLRNLQGQSLGWRVRTAFAAGCAGVVIFSWIDEWFRADSRVEDWAFGLTTRSHYNVCRGRARSGWAVHVAAALIHVNYPTTESLTPRVSHAAIVALRFFGTLATLAAGVRATDECAFATGVLQNAISTLEREVA